MKESVGGRAPDVEVESKKECAEFHIVGVGASAGGLEALEAFFSAIPSDSGMAFVVVQHLSPDFKSHMEQLLGRRTTMQVWRVENEMEVQPNSVYLIPPRMEMVISEGRLLLTEKTERSLSHPIDQFFRSLAADIGRYAIGVVLSGTGSDGSRGIRDIRDAGGLVIAQDENSAKFDGMPMNAQSTGCVDLVLPPEGIAEAIVRYVRDGLTPQSMAEEELVVCTAGGVDRIFELLNQQHNLDFSHYKATTVGRRIQRRVDLLGLASVDEYVSQLEHDPGELNDLYKDLLIGVTKFFRDPEAFDVIEEDVIPKLWSQLADDEPIRVWVAGCATGEEAYSIAILFDEAVRRTKHRREIKIFATDAHHVSLHTAARAVFAEESLEEMSEARRERYFRKQRNGYYVTRDLRRLVVFAPHNVIRDAPFTQMDLVCCRNMLIYLQPQAQKKALSMFHFALKSQGVLFLGPSESPGELSDEFQTIDKRWKVYSKKRDVRLPIDTNLAITSPLTTAKFSTSTPLSAAPSKVDRSLIDTYDRLLDRKMPPSVLVNDKFEMLHTFGGAERYLKLRSGRPSLQLLELVHDALKTPLAGALQHATRKQKLVRYTGIEVRTDEELEVIALTVDPIMDSESKIESLLVEIEKSTKPSSSEEVEETVVNVGDLTRARVASLESELRYSQENLQATIEEMETTNEELQATNEELVASNEELQSTNEELHSVNEELYTVNAENQRRMEEVNLANEDMDNLLATTRVGVIFLDHELYIRRFTPEIGRRFHLMPQDVGRSIEGFVHNLKHKSLIKDLREVLTRQRETEIYVRDQNENHFILRMFPYRSGEKVNGVVLTLIDVNALRETQADLEKFKFMAEGGREAMSLIERNGRFTYANPTQCEWLGLTEDEMSQKTVMDIDPNYDFRRFRETFDRAIAGDTATFESLHRRKNGSVYPVEITLSVIEISEVPHLFAYVRDITQRLKFEHEMRIQRLAIQSTSNGIVITDAQAEDNPIIYANPGFLELTGFERDEVVGRNCRFLQGADTDRAIVQQIREAVESARAFRNTVLNFRKDGSAFWNDLQITPVFDEHQKLTNFVGVQSDVTELRRTHDELAQAVALQERTMDNLKESEQKAKQASLAKSEFLANISHELRSPMTAVLGFADILQDKLDDPTLVEKTATIKRNGEHILALLNDMLDLSKIEAGKMQFNEDTIELQSLAADIRSLMDVRAAEKGIPLHVRFMTDVPRTIRGDRIRIRQILVNLISNALKFTDEGEVCVRFALSEDSAPRLNIAVKDTGIGMTNEEQSRLFEPFSQARTETARRFGGTGLGLSISKRLADGMGAKIWLESELNVGSCFTLSIPLSPHSTDNLITVKDSTGSVVEAPESALPALDADVLLVDDRRDVWQIGKYFLEKCGARVTIAENGRDAVEAIQVAQKRGKPFSLILMDMQMPIMTGREAIGKIREMGVRVPVVALTADAMDGQREECLQLGFDEYFAKPIDGLKLMEICAKLVRGANSPEGEST